MKTHKEIEEFIRNNPQFIRELLEGLSDSFETEGCDGCGTLGNDDMNKVHEVLGRELLELEDTEDEDAKTCLECGCLIITRMVPVTGRRADKSLHEVTGCSNPDCDEFTG